MRQPVPTSVVLLVERDAPVPAGLTASFEHALGSGHVLREVVVAASDRARETIAAVDRQRAGDPRLSLVVLSHWFDAAAALQRVLPDITGAIVVTMRIGDLEDRAQLPALIGRLAAADVAALTPPATRGLGLGALPDRFTRRIFDVPFAVVTSTMRAHRRPVLERFGDRSVPLALQPLLIAWQGGRVATLPHGGRRRAGAFASAIGHALAAPLLYCLLSFTRRPLQLFGIVGMAAALAGMAITLPLIADRLIHGIPLADEPALIPGLLLCAMGVQSAAIGLLAELLVFARAQTLKEDVGEQLLD